MRVISGCGRPADSPIDERLLVDPAEAAERLLRRAGDDLGPQVEQHQQVAQVAGEERHLVGAGDQHLLGGDDRVDRRLDVGAEQLVRRVLDVDVVGGQRRLELGVVEREQRRRRGERLGGAGRTAAVLVASGLLELGEALESERLREAHDGARGRAGAARELLRGLERRLVEMIDDVLRDVLLRARELVEAGADVRGQGLVAVGRLSRRWRSRWWLASSAGVSFDAGRRRSFSDVTPSLHRAVVRRARTRTADTAHARPSSPASS